MPKQTFFNLPEPKRTLIFNCAVDEFVEHGYEQSSINRIVEAAGIAKGSFYQYFEDKLDLYQHVINVGIADPKLDSVALAQSPEVLGTLPFFELLRFMFKRNLMVVGEDPRFLKIGVDLARNRDSEAYKRIMGSYADATNRFFYDFIEAKKASGEIAADIDSWVLNYLLYGTFEYTMSVIARGEEGLYDGRYIDHLVDALERILSGGIFTKTGGAPLRDNAITAESGGVE